MRPEEYEKMYRTEDAHWWFAGKRRLARVVLGAPGASPRRILDVGCGTGGMFALLRQYGCVHGADASGLALGFAARRRLAQLELAALPHLPYASSTFDLVTAFDVLYHQHVEDDRLALREIARVLAPGGQLLVTDSAFGFLRSTHDEAVQGARRYTTGDMGAKLAAAGLAVRRLSYANCFIFPIAAPWRLLVRFADSGRDKAARGSDVADAPAWLNTLMGWLYRAEAALLARADLPVGMSIIALAQKPADSQ